MLTIMSIPDRLCSTSCSIAERKGKTVSSMYTMMTDSTKSPLQALIVHYRQAVIKSLHLGGREGKLQQTVLSAELCQPAQHYNNQSLKEPRTNLIHPWGPATKELFNHLADLVSRGQPGLGELNPESPGSASSVEGMLVGLRRSSKFSAH
ncbi:hypothetical protein CCH79_00007727, partial [Gambusia affinis]